MFPGGLALAEEEERAAVDAVREVIRSKRLYRYYGAGSSRFRRSRVAELEQRFARKVGAPHALAVNSGTSALICGLVGLGIGPGDEVILPAYTWCSLPSAVMAVGAVPIVAEVDDSLTIDPSDVERMISPHTKGVIAVHMRGAPAAMDRLMQLGSERQLAVMEDAAQATGGSFRGRPLGSIGDAGVFSFQMSKVMTAGEGGMLVVKDPDCHRRAATFHDAGAGLEMDLQAVEWLSGLNLKMSELHAAVLLAQLDRLDDLVAGMRANKQRLKGRLTDRLDRCGVRLRMLNDASGDIATALILFLPEAGQAGSLVSALAAENVPASRLLGDDPAQNDYASLHFYAGWRPLLDKRPWSLRGGPWSRHPREIEYPLDAAPRTHDLLRRAVHIDVSPELSPQQVDAIGDAIIDLAEDLD